MGHIGVADLHMKHHGLRKGKEKQKGGENRCFGGDLQGF